MLPCQQGLSDAIPDQVIGMADFDADWGFEAAVQYAKLPAWMPIRLPLSFHDIQMEVDYTQTTRLTLKRVAKAIAVCCAVTVLLGSILSVIDDNSAGQDRVLQSNTGKGKNDDKGFELRRTHIVAWCIRVIAGLSPFVFAACRPTEFGALVFGIVLFICILLNHRYRAAFVAGEANDIEDIFPTQPSSILHSDAVVMGYLAMVSITVSVTIRAKFGAFMVLLSPMTYLMFTLPMPELEGGKPIRHISLALQLAIISIICLLVRTHLEEKERRDIYIKTKLSLTFL